MRDDNFFTPEEMAAFRAVDQERALERETEAVSTVERVVTPVAAAFGRAVPPAAATRMSVERSADWNRWANEMIERALMPLAKDLGAEVGDIERRLKAEIKTITNDMAALRAENVELRVQLSYLRGAADHSRPGEVLDLPALPRRGLNG
jgi:hypothetical protein